MRHKTVATNDLWGGDDAQPFRALQAISCIIGQCPGLMLLNILGEDGALLARPFNDGPYYRCNRVGCYYHEHPRGLHELNSTWIRDTNAPKKRTEVSVSDE